VGKPEAEPFGARRSRSHSDCRSRGRRTRRPPSLRTARHCNLTPLLCLTTASLPDRPEPNGEAPHATFCFPLFAHSHFGERRCHNTTALEVAKAEP
jgi:hypothetical protein